MSVKPDKFSMIDTHVFVGAFKHIPECNDSYYFSWFKCFHLVINNKLIDEYYEHIARIGYSSKKFLSSLIAGWGNCRKLESIEDISLEEEMENRSKSPFNKFTEDIVLLIPLIKFKRKNVNRKNDVYFITDEIEIKNNAELIKTKYGIIIQSPKQFSKHVCSYPNCTTESLPLLNLN
jgi:hypothetical protein